jgi:methyl-accepting chemotaxis protein
MNAILKWQNMEEDVYILVYKNNRLIFNSTWWDDDMIMDSVYQIDEVIEEETDTTQSDVSESDSADMTSQDYVQNSETDNYLWNIKNSVSVAEEIAEETHEDQIEEDEKAGAEEDQTEEDEKTGAGEDKTEENNTGEAYSHEMVLIDDASDEYKFYPVKFDDGVYDVCVIDYSDYNIYNIALIIELALSGIVFMCIILWYNRRLINRVSRLSTEIVHIENDDINAPITKTGRDELQVLSENIDSMRDTIIEQLSNEREAWQANRDLVTSMAHDIRTPLTVLNGYLDLLNEKEYDSEEAMEEYLNICSEKAEQLKDLSDKLFRYFFVYSGKKDDLNFEIYDAGVLFQQIHYSAERKRL